jgi:hypothetical protein
LVPIRTSRVRGERGVVVSEWLVALDFGTTATAAAVSSGGEPRALTLADGSSTVPSSVFCEDDGRLLVGVEADNEAELRLDAYEPTPKRRVADDRVRLGDHEFSPAQLIGAVMAPVLAEAIRQHNETVPSKVVLTHPVSWRAQRRAVLAEALSVAQIQLRVAGLGAPLFVAEPVAAARWYTHTDPAAVGSYFAVYDLGGGTFDTTVLRAAGAGQFDVVASGGIDPLGGFDFDAALFTYLGQRYIGAADPELWAALSRPGRADPDIARQRRRLQQRVGLLKTGLSSSPDKRIQLPGVKDPVVVTRAEYEALIAGDVDATVAELETTISDAGLTADQLTAIYRIGGAARTPLVGAVLDRLHVPLKVLDQPKLVVAKGAATHNTTATTPTPAPVPKQLADPQSVTDTPPTTTAPPRPTPTPVRPRVTRPNHLDQDDTTPPTGAPPDTPPFQRLNRSTKIILGVGSGAVVVVLAIIASITNTTNTQPGSPQLGSAGVPSTTSSSTPYPLSSGPDATTSYAAPPATNADPASGNTCPSLVPASGGTPEWTLPGATGSAAVTGSTDTTAPVITVTAPFSVTQTQVHTLQAGDGPVIVPTATVSVCYVGVNGRDGSIFDSSYQRGKAANFPLDGVVAGFQKAIVGQRVGSAVAVAMTSADGYPDGQPAAGIQPGDSQVFAIRILGAS